MTTLSDFTHVDASPVAVLETGVIAVYLASQQGYENFCRGCEKLLMCQEFGEYVRVFCQVEKCVK